MNFLHPEFLYYMLPPLFILFGFLLTQKEPEARFFDKDILDKLRARSDSLTLKARNALFLLAGVFIIVALAQPVIEEGKVEVKSKSADTIIALDISDSMLAEDIYPNRLEAAKQKVLEFLKLAQGSRVGVTAFAQESFLVSPLSFDLDAVSFLVSRLQSYSVTRKGTDISSLLESVGKMQKETEKKYLLIFSDGGDKSDLSKEIAAAKKHGITVFIIGMGTKSGSPIKLSDSTFLKHNGEVIVSKLNESISDLALGSGGVYIENSTSMRDIGTMYKEINAAAKEKEIKSEELKRHTPLFYYPLSAALLILLIATSSIKRTSAGLGVFVLLIFFDTLHVEASMLDFIKLKEAKEAYLGGEYEKSAGIYESYSREAQDPHASYNAANAYYKAQNYDKAIELYKDVKFDDDRETADNLSNLGNAYAKKGELEKAAENYEKSLELREDKETRENLKEVKKALDGQQNQKEQKQDGQKQDSKSEEKNSDKKDDKQDSKDETSDKDGDKSKEDASEQKEPKRDDKPQSKSEPQKESKEKQESALADEKASDTNSSQTNAQKLEQQEHSMSDAEQKKWLELINDNTASYLYRLDEKTKEDDDLMQKPW